ncbi:MAG: aspartate/glutamate racemase family protein, partial [Methylophilaceae bacterium]|nr:aspartate/glutamate racemase family protein [Methylophilaceae bacterium]
IANYVRPLLEAEADTIVLGCTHYPFVRALIEEQVGNNVTLIDTGEAVARQVQRRLQEAQLLNDGIGEPRNTFWVNRDTNIKFVETAEIISALWGSDGSSVDFFPLPD